MELSRRDALRAGGGLLAAAALSGCVEERVTRRETRVTDNSAWSLSTATEDVALSATEFDNYTERMADRYGDSGVWGSDGDPGEEFETAYVQRYAIKRETPGSPTESEFDLVPDNVDPEAPMLIADSCVALYRTDDGRHRYWLWAATDSTDSRLVRDVNVTEIAAGVRFRNAPLDDAAVPSALGDEATASLGTPPSASFPVRGGALDVTNIRDDMSVYGVEWGGELDGIQSVNGVCEVSHPGAYEFEWTMSLGYNFYETV